MGSLFKLPILRFADIDFLFEEVARWDLTTVGSVATGGTPLPQVNFDRSPVALFLGSEPFGLPEPVTSRMDRLVTVPMPGEVDSFSVNAAAAILLYEIGRGR